MVVQMPWAVTEAAGGLEILLVNELLERKIFSFDFFFLKKRCVTFDKTIGYVTISNYFKKMEKLIF